VQLVLVLASAVFLGSEFGRSREQISLYQLCDPPPYLEGLVPLFVFPRKRVVQFSPEAQALSNSFNIITGYVFGCIYIYIYICIY
jgi:hypothetical protein